MMANMASSLIEHKRITTTVAKAKALRTFVEPLITRSKEDSTHSRRMVFKELRSKNAVSELFREIAPKVADRPGGYTRIIKTGFRSGDSAEVCMIELVDYNEMYNPNEKAGGKKKRRRRGGKKKSGEAQNQQGAQAENTSTEETQAPAPAEQKSEAKPETEAKAKPEAKTEEKPKTEAKKSEEKAADKEKKTEAKKADEPKAEKKEEPKSKTKDSDSKDEKGKSGE